MRNLKQKRLDSDTLYDVYSKQIVVYLESPDDCRFYENYWFQDRLNQFKFKPPSEGAATCDGCQGVRVSVADDRDNGIGAYGIVDRDIVMAEKLWHLVWETDDKVFIQAQPFGPYIRVLNRWEIENYLIDAQVVEDFLANSTGRSRRSIDTVHEELLQHCEVLILHTAANSVCHNNGKNSYKDGFTNNKNKAQVDSEFRDRFKEPSYLQEYQENIMKAKSFGDPSTSASNHFQQLLRIVCGKALLSRLKGQHKIGNEIRFHLADAIRKTRGTPKEIADYLDGFAAAT